MPSLELNSEPEYISRADTILPPPEQPVPVGGIIGQPFDGSPWEAGMDFHTTIPADGLPFSPDARFGGSDEAGGNGRDNEVLKLTLDDIRPEQIVMGGVGNGKTRPLREPTEEANTRSDIVADDNGAEPPPELPSHESAGYETQQDTDENTVTKGGQPPAEPPINAEAPPAEEPDDEPQPFLPFRQQFDGTQEPPPPEEQKAVSTLFNDYTTTHLEQAKVSTNTTNRIYEGRHIEIGVRIDRGRTFENRSITIAEIVAEGENRGWVRHPNLVKYELSEGVVRRVDPLPERSPKDSLITSDPGDTPLISATKEGALSVFSQMHDLQKLGAWNQPIGKEEMLAVIKYIKDVQEHGETNGVVTSRMR